MVETADIRPQPGPQEAFLASPADIVIYGGAAGGGKTFAELMEPLRHVHRKGFGAVTFRREHKQITNQGGLWDEAGNIYPYCEGVPMKTPHLGYRWPSGAKHTFAHLNHVEDVQAWQGAQIALIQFDELTHFEESQFWYMLSRNRSSCGIRPYIRATTNPKVDSWVEKLLAWWIEQDETKPGYGLPIPERAGVVRWFIRLNGRLEWGDSPDFAIEHGMRPEDAKSLTFIPAKVTDNKKLLDKDPGYLANLKALSRVEQGRLMDGNWKIRPAAGMYFRRSEVTILDTAPPCVRWIRAYDLAATEQGEDSPNPDWTAGIKMGIQANGRIAIAHVRRDRKRAAGVRTMVEDVARSDGQQCAIALPQDPGQAGKGQADDYVLALAKLGFPARAWPVTGDKVVRAEPIAALWQHGQVDVVRGTWNEAFFGELEAFPSKGVHDDQVDALSLAHWALLHDFRPSAATTASIRI
jgi:predicted phage terminase large subunit-like protein